MRKEVKNQLQRYYLSLSEPKPAIRQSVKYLLFYYYHLIPNALIFSNLSTVKYPLFDYLTIQNQLNYQVRVKAKYHLNCMK